MLPLNKRNWIAQLYLPRLVRGSRGRIYLCCSWVSFANIERTVCVPPCQGRRTSYERVSFWVTLLIKSQTHYLRSNRLGLVERPGSNLSKWFVVPMTSSPSFPSRPSSWLRKNDLFLSVIRLSKSSMTTTQGDSWRALLKTSAMAASSPRKSIKTVWYQRRLLHYCITDILWNDLT